MSEPPALQNNIPTAIRGVVRTDISLSGRYTLANRRKITGMRREFDCRTASISSAELALIAPVSGAIGERVIVHFDEFGTLQGQISRLMKDGFVMRLILGRSQSVLLKMRIDWLDKHHNQIVPDVRAHKRTIPRNPHSTVLLPDGSMRSCLVIDMSVSGVAVCADVDVRIGDVLAVGRVIGRVVRLFPEGFAIQFTDLLDPHAMEYLLTPS